MFTAAGGTSIVLTELPDRTPPPYPVVSFLVEGIDDLVGELKARGATFEHLPGAASFAGQAGARHGEVMDFGAVKSAGSSTPRAICSRSTAAWAAAWRRVSVLSHARAGAQRYRSLLALPGARAPVVLSAAGSMPIGMFGLGILLLARDATGSFAEAGRVVGAFSVANALGAVAQGRLMDRLGQTRVLRAAAPGHVPALAALVIAADARARRPGCWRSARCAAARPSPGPRRDALAVGRAGRGRPPSARPPTRWCRSSSRSRWSPRRRWSPRSSRSARPQVAVLAAAALGAGAASRSR